MHEDDEEAKRMLALSKQFEATEQRMYGNGVEVSDGSSYYSSSETGPRGISWTTWSGVDEQGDHDDAMAQRGVGQLDWGAAGPQLLRRRRRGRAFPEALAAQAISGAARRGGGRTADADRRDAVPAQKDFVDPEMEMLALQQQPGQGHEQEEQGAVQSVRKHKKKKKGRKLRRKRKQKSDEDDQEQQDDEASEVQNVERIRKEVGGGGEHVAQRIRRNHPELVELRRTVREMSCVYAERQRAIEKRFDAAMEDSIREHAALYLQLKAAKAEAAQLSKHGIFGVLLRLKHRVGSLRKVHRQSMALMARLPSGPRRSCWPTSSSGSARWRRSARARRRRRGGWRARAGARTGSSRRRRRR